MASRDEQAFNFEKKRFGELFGQPFRVASVNYTAQNQLPVTTKPRKMYKAEVTTDRLVQTALPNGSYYCCHGDYNGINTGDMLFPLRADSNTPILTFISKSPFEEMTAFRTSLLCDIYNGDSILYSNVYFDFASRGNTAATGLHRLVTSSPLAQNQIFMYKRALRGVNFDLENLLIREQASPYVTWAIKQSSDIGGLMLLDVEISVVN